VHHVRTVHVSATNFPGTERRLLLFQYRAADVWPPLSCAGGVEKFDDLLLAGSPTLMPRLAPVPVRLPLPASRISGADLREPAIRLPAVL
jgi:phytanoyl-CoA hydroxylase